jgi:thiosulfate/3-mercaptopyruvate sulfurtransferase
MNITSRLIDPVVSTGHMEDELKKKSLTVIDIRPDEEYRSGHIPGAASLPFTYWAISKDGLDLELPDDKELSRLISTAGINSNSTVIIVNKTDNTFSLANACRVADTLIYAGISSVSILDGGHNKWIRENRPLSVEPVKPEVSDHRITADRTMFVSMDYVKSKIEKSFLIDARDPAVYFGIVKEPHAARPGHIPGAKSLPAPWIWTAEGTFRDRNELSEMAGGIVDKNNHNEIIIYCGVGGYTSAWWFVLTQMMGYKNVKFYDGSAQDWTRNFQNPVVKYKWE